MMKVMLSMVDEVLWNTAISIAENGRRSGDY